MSTVFWLKALLTDYKRLPARKIRRASINAGFTKGQVRAARKELGVIVEKEETEDGEEWFWRLPEDDYEGKQN